MVLSTNGIESNILLSIVFLMQTSLRNDNYPSFSTITKDNIIVRIIIV